MNPQPLFCLHLDCPSRGQENAGNIRVHQSLQDRWRCQTCDTTFAATKTTRFYRLKTDPKSVVCVRTLLAWGTLVQVIGRAFGLEARTVGRWQALAGQIGDEVAQVSGLRRGAKHWRHLLRREKTAYKRPSRNLKHKQNQEQVATKQAELETLQQRGTPPR